MNEKLLNSNDTDVTIECSDGSVRAHKFFLRAASDALACMIDHDMRENTNGVITFPDVTVQMVSVFRTILRTRHANPADWNERMVVPHHCSFCLGLLHWLRGT